MLQSIFMTIQTSDASNKDQSEMFKVDADYVYRITGSISPKDINDILDILLNDKIFTGVKKIRQKQVEKGISLNVILKELSELMIFMNLPSKMKEFLFQRMA